MNIVKIDTSNNKEVTVGLKIDDKEYVCNQVLDRRKAQMVLPLLEKLLQENSLRLHDINSIEVNCGPGSFTGLRVGITIANTLGSLLQIPINSKKVGELAVAVY